MARKGSPKTVIDIDTTQLDEAIVKVQKLRDMLYEVDSLTSKILRGSDANREERTT
jgi:hypothetical protein